VNLVDAYNEAVGELEDWAELAARRFDKHRFAIRPMSDGEGRALVAEGREKAELVEELLLALAPQRYRRIERVEELEEPEPEPQTFTFMSGNSRFGVLRTVAVLPPEPRDRWGGPPKGWMARNPHRTAG
jgi:hypothetical protein